ncbi:hypothetical protein RM863_12720 [Streptomyces sp. DSM 41014]|uniref:Uncharacterized protein n=1 Tax=Streptomyces hintoniae TaxID=3075521 RepID=A0ABU2UI89_9ACTN|nr:hypothetical protein [Streptomyces sp. DSM 41014]MDT0472987.1 hypothetical protein [Streptomyces sp. DSM 41014]
MLAAVFLLAVAVALIGIALVDWRSLPPVLATGALILTLAALGAAVLR